MGNRRITYENLGEFIQRLEAEGELLRIKETVDPVLQITEIADRVSKSPGGGKALLFENVTGSDMPLLINAYGSDRRMAMALGVDDVEEIARQITEILHPHPPESFSEKIGTVRMLMDIAKYPPKKITGSAPCQEIVQTGDDIDLEQLPVLKCWPDDAGRFVTFPLVITESLDAKRNMGMYRMQLFDKRTTGMHWHIHKDGAHHYHQYKKAGRRMAVSVAIGTDPVVTYAATAPLPKDVDEFLLAGLIRRKPVKLAKCKTNHLYVPAEAEIVVEGYVDPAEDLRIEGPFGDHTGYYSLADDYPVFHVTAVTRRRNPVYFTTIVGKPPMEDCHIGRATARIFLPLLKTVTPEVTDYDLPWEGVFHNCVIVAMEKRYPGAAQRLMNALWGTGQMSFAKMILAVGEEIDVHDHPAVFRHVLSMLDTRTDIFMSQGVLDVLDHSAPQPLFGSKIGIDTTPRAKGEKERSLPSLGAVDEAVIVKETTEQSVTAFFIPEKETRSRVMICSVKKKTPGDAVERAGNLLSEATGGMVNIIVMVDDDIDPSDLSTVTWKVFNNTDPRRDILKRGKGLIVDATKKWKIEGHARPWPDDIVMDDGTKAEVDRLWPQLGIDG